MFVWRGERVHKVTADPCDCKSTECKEGAEQAAFCPCRIARDKKVELYHCPIHGVNFFIGGKCPGCHNLRMSKVK